MTVHFFFFQAEDGIRDPLGSRGLGEVYRRQRQIQTPPRMGLFGGYVFLDEKREFLSLAIKIFFGDKKV